MTPSEGERLLTGDDPPPFTVERPAGSSPFVLLGDHAGRRIPRLLGDLGVPETERARHIAWDIGIAEVAKLVSASLDAFLILQTYSRLVIDCNRPPGTEQSIVTVSERTKIPGNEGLTPADAERRQREIFHPYHERVHAELLARAQAGREPTLVSMHSFTPSYMDSARAWHAGVLYQRDARLARPLLELLRAEAGLVVGDNEPYAMHDDTDYTMVVHGERRGLVHVELELRQDLIAHDAGQRAWAERLARLLPLALAQARAATCGA